MCDQKFFDMSLICLCNKYFDVAVLFIMYSNFLINQFIIDIIFCILYMGGA